MKWKNSDPREAVDNGVMSIVVVSAFSQIVWTAEVCTADPPVSHGGLWTVRSVNPCAGLKIDLDVDDVWPDHLLWSPEPTAPSPSADAKSSKTENPASLEHLQSLPRHSSAIPRPQIEKMRPPREQEVALREENAQLRSDATKVASLIVELESEVASQAVLLEACLPHLKQWVDHLEELSASYVTPALRGLIETLEVLTVNAEGDSP